MLLRNGLTEILGISSIVYIFEKYILLYNTAVSVIKRNLSKGVIFKLFKVIKFNRLCENV